MGQKPRGDLAGLYTLSLIARSAATGSTPSDEELEKILKLPSPEKEHTLVRRLCEGCATLRMREAYDRNLIQIT